MTNALKRAGAVVLVAAMAAGLFAGCKKETPNPAGGSQPSVTSKEELKQTKPVIYYRKADAKRDNLPDNQKMKAYIEEKSGVKIEIHPIPQDAYQDKINLMIAAAETFDAFDFGAFGGSHWSQLLDKKAIVPLNELLDKYGANIKKAVGEDGFLTVSTKDKKIYGIPRKEEFPAGFIPSIREDWLKKLGIQRPTTMEELEKYLEAVITKDPNGNGKNDEFGLIPQWGFGGIESDFKPYFVGINGERYWDESAGKVMPIYAHPGYKAMVLKIAEWFRKGYLYKEFLTIKPNQINDQIISDRVGMVAGWYNSYVNPQKELRKTKPEAQYIAIPPLKGGKVAGYSSNSEANPHILFSATGQNAVFLIKYMDWLLADKDNYRTAKGGIKGEHWDWADRDKSIMKSVPDAQSKEKYSGLYQILEMEGNTNFRVTSEKLDEVGMETNKIKEYVRGSGAKFLVAFDDFVPYSDKGTAAEALTGDGKTMIEEARTKLIMGEIKESDFDAALKKYMDIEGKVRSEVWTKQYKEFTGK